MDAEEIAVKAMTIAADICVYTNHNVRLERIDESTLKAAEDKKDADGAEPKQIPEL